MSKTAPVRSQTALKPKVWAKGALKWRAFVSGLIVLTLLGGSLAQVAQATTPGERAPAGEADSVLAPETGPAAAPPVRESPEPAADDSLVDDDNLVDADPDDRETPAVRNLAPDKAEPDDHCAQARDCQ